MSSPCVLAKVIKAAPGGWYSVGGGESGHIAVDARDTNIVYAGSYGGTITRYDHRTGYRRNILDYPQLQLGQAPRLEQEQHPHRRHQETGGDARAPPHPVR